MHQVMQKVSCRVSVILAAIIKWQKSEVPGVSSRLETLYFKKGTSAHQSTNTFKLR